MLKLKVSFAFVLTLIIISSILPSIIKSDVFAEKNDIKIFFDNENTIPIGEKIGEYFFNNNIELWHYSGGYWEYKNIRIYDKDLNYDLYNSEKLVGSINEDVTFEANIDIELYKKLKAYEKIFIVCSTTLPGKKVTDLFSGIPEIKLLDNKIIFKAKPKFHFINDISFYEIIGEKLNVDIPIVDPEYGCNKYAIWNRYRKEEWGGAFGYFDKNDPFAYAPADSFRISPAQIKNARGHLIDGFTFDTDGIKRVSNDSSVGYGTFNSGGAVGICFYYPIKFEFYSGRVNNDLWLQLEELPSSVAAGDKVQVILQVKSSFEENLSIEAGNAPFYKWEIVDKATNQAISPVKFEGYANTATGNLELAAKGETALYAEFVMPEKDVYIRFEINKDGTMPKETLVGNNVVEAVITTALPINVTGDLELDYNVLSRSISFPLADGNDITARLTAPSGRLFGNAWGFLSVTNDTPSIFRGLESFNIRIDEPAGTVVKKTQINATIYRKDATYDARTGSYDNPPEGKWLKGPDSKTITGKISFGGTVYGNYEYEVTGLNSDGSIKVETKTSVTSASFRPGTDSKRITTYIYNGRPTIPVKTFENKIENNSVYSFSKNMFWTSEPYLFDVIRWMCHQREDGTLYGWTPVPGEYKRTFTQQNSAIINWSVANTMEKDYKRSRDAARAGDRRKTEYDKAVFASDLSLKNVDYPIKSGYYFNPTGTYTFTVETVTYKTTATPTEDHRELVDALIDSFRYETDLMYINSNNQAVNIQNEVLSRNGKEYARRPAALTAKDPTGVDGIKLLYVDKTYKIDTEELKHSQNSGEYTHEYFKAILEGYEESGTLGSKNNYKYREYIKDGQSMYKVIEKTTVSIKINPDNKKLYTHINMPDSKYTVSTWIADVTLSDLNSEYKKLGVLKGILPLDRIEVTVSGSLYDDQNPVILN